MFMLIINRFCPCLVGKLSHEIKDDSVATITFLALVRFMQFSHVCTMVAMQI